MATLSKKALPDVVAERVDEKGRPMKGDDGKTITKKFSGQTWKLAGSDPVSNGGWKIQEAKTPEEIVETGNLTSATMNDGAGSGVDGKNREASEGKTGDDVDETEKTAAKGKPGRKKKQDETSANNAKSADSADTNDDEPVVDVTNKIV